MKFNFKKISAIAASTLMAGMSLGFAAAAAYPAPFISGGVANVAIVYGTGAGVSSLDLVHAGNIQSNLQSNLGGSTTSTTTVTGGDSVKFEKTSTKWTMGLGLLNVKATDVTDDDMGTLLADGTFTDNDNDEFDFIQKIEMANITTAMFEDNDYKDDEPTVGIRIASASHILNYTLDFTETPIWTDLETSDITIMGKNYYVLDVPIANTSITLLDAAESTIIDEGDTATLTVGNTTYTVSVSFIGESSVKLDIDGTLTNSLGEGETQKIATGAYVGIKDILYTAKDTGISKVEFSIGSGKLELDDANDVEMNDDQIDDLLVYLGGQGGDDVEYITISWSADDDLFVTPDSEITMPGFGAVKLSSTGMVYPVEEEILVENNGDTNIVLKNFPLKSSTEDIYILEWDTTVGFDSIGKDSDEMLLVTNSTNFSFNADLYDSFIASWSDGNDAESYLMRLGSFTTVSGHDKVTLQYRADEAWKDVKKDANETDTATVGNIEFTFGQISKSAKTARIWATSSNTEFDVLYSKEGAKIYLPWNATEQPLINMSVSNTQYAGIEAACDAISTSLIGAYVAYNHSSAVDLMGVGSCNQTTVPIIFSEEDGDDDIGQGGNLTITFGERSAAADEVDVASVSGGDGTDTEILDTDVERNFKYTPLATEYLFDKGGDQEKLKLIYHGSESYNEVFLTDVSAILTAGTITTGAQLGDVLVKDSEVSSVATKNLIVVGGSCINSAAATLVGGAHCGAAWTTATGVGSGQFLIKGYASSTLTTKLALLVAGYDAADTVNAATYLRTKAFDTSKEYLGTSATSATLVTAEA